MKTMRLFCIVLFALSACSTVTLVDQAMNTIVIQASKDQPDSVIVSWTGADYYAGYQVLRAESLKSAFEPISSQLAGVQAFTDTNVQAGRVYYYKVQAYNANNVRMYTTEAEQGFAGGDFVYPPRWLELSQGLYEDKIVLKWNEAPKAVSYRIRRSTDESNWTILDPNYQMTSYEDKTVTPSQIYYYQIVSIDALGEASIPSASVSGYAMVNYAQFRASAGIYPDYNELSWKNPEGTAKAVIYRADTVGQLGQKIAVLEDKSTLYKDYTDMGVKYYMIRFFSADDYIILETPSQEGYRLNPIIAPEGVLASQGDHQDKVVVTWNAVSGATSYTVQRSINKGVSWDLVGRDSVTSLEDTTLPTNQSQALYRVAANSNELQGPYSSVSVEGWPNRAPLNVRSQKIYGNRVELFWQATRDAQEYEIFVSSSATGPFNSVGTTTSTQYSHPQGISGNEAQFYYAVRVKNSKNLWSRNSYEDYKSSAEAWVAKGAAPQNILIANNKTSTDRHLSLNWSPSKAASKYLIYRATLMHGGATINNLNFPADYEQIAETENLNYNDTLSAAPIRRYHYVIALVDADGTEYRGFAADSSGSQIAYRLPVDVYEFMTDTDFNIIEAQTRIKNFGNNNSSGAPKARWQGWYDYKASALGSKSLWKTFASFEVVLNSRANHKISVTLNPMGAKQEGDVDVSGLYTGVITYNDLVGAEGGWSVGGGLTGTYNHPVKGTLTKTYTHLEAAFLQSIVIKGQESKPTYDSLAIVEGVGGSIQAGWSPSLIGS